MHETALVAGILRIVNEEAARHGAARITRVKLQVGLLAAVEPVTLTSCFSLYAEGTVAEGAGLDVEMLPMHGTCRACGRDIELAVRRFVCPACGAVALDLDGGNEMRIASIEAQHAEEERP